MITDEPGPKAIVVTGFGWDFGGVGNVGRTESITAALDSGAACGRRLEFLAQEMSREANTIGSKAGNAEIAHIVVEMKEEIEKLKEQVLNVE